MLWILLLLQGSIWETATFSTCLVALTHLLLGWWKPSFHPARSWLLFLSTLCKSLLIGLLPVVFFQFSASYNNGVCSSVPGTGLGTLRELSQCVFTSARRLQIGIVSTCYWFSFNAFEFSKVFLCLLHEVPGPLTPSVSDFNWISRVI